MKITLCLVTWNEIDGCKHDVPLINKKAFDDIYAIDGGSKDGTREYLKKQKIPVYTQKKKGLNAAHILAVKKCKTEAIIFFHPKGTVPIADTLKFRKLFEEGYEFVVASRMIKGSKNEEDNYFFKPRKWLVLSLAIIISLLWRKEGHLVWDVLHGFRGMTVKTFEKINPEKTQPTIDIDGVITSYKKKIKRIEFPTKEKPRIGGKTHFKTIPFGLKILKYLFKEIFFQD